MKCEVCGIGVRKSQLISYKLLLEDKLVVVEHVPADVCNHCGEITLTPETVERLQQTVWQSRLPIRMLETPVYEFV
jgi:YgiT-type zinc finger domain-containing protein